MLTTITPFWQRPEMLRCWFPAVAGATFGNLKHLIFFVGEPIPDWVQKEYGCDPRFHLISQMGDVPGDLSIGHYHNLGARLACTEWIMKMDVDTLPNVHYFRELLPMLSRAGGREWFNGGMVYVDEAPTHTYLSAHQMPLSEKTYRHIMANRSSLCGRLSHGPAATNFICRTSEYLKLGGCDERFRGYGWEDYQQIYALESHYRGKDPLPGTLNEANVTQRCCREISRPKAHNLWMRNSWLCLLHRCHPASPNRSYKSHEGMLRNRKVLLDFILKARDNKACQTITTTT